MPQHILPEDRQSECRNTFRCQNWYDTTPNPGGEYKARITPITSYNNCSKSSSNITYRFCDSDSKTDNFKVASTTSAYINVCKFNDANGNGVQDAGEPFIPGWPIVVTGVDTPRGPLGAVNGQTGTDGCITDANARTLLFNFATATSVTIDGQIDTTVLGPNAYLSGGSQMGGGFIAASIGSTGEVRCDPFTGALPTGVCSNIPAALSVSCAAVTTGTVGAAFNSDSVTVTGGTAPYAYSVVGTLPAGLTLNTLTGAITGTPTASGTFQVKVIDAHGATGTTCAITINPGQAQAPKFSLKAGTCKGPQTVTTTDATAGITFYYTANGTTPTTSSTKYTGPVKVSATETLEAIAVAPGYATSAVTSANDIIK